MTKSERRRRRESAAAAGRRLTVVMLGAGALYAAGRVQAQPDASGIAPPQTVSIEAAQSAVADGIERLAARYARWQQGQVPAASAATLPILPVAAAAPPLPDAPDGEITQQLEGLGQ